MAYQLTNTLTGPIAKIHARLTSCHTSNCLIKGNSLPVYKTLCAGGKVMLLTNFVVEQFIFNGSIGDLIDIKFADPDGPKADEPKGYAIVNFPLSNIRTRRQGTHPRLAKHVHPRPHGQNAL